MKEYLYHVIIRNSKFQLKSEHYVTATPTKIPYEADKYKWEESDRVFIKQLDTNG